MNKAQLLSSGVHDLVAEACTRTHGRMKTGREKRGLGRASRKVGFQEEGRKVSKGPVSKAHHSSGAGEHFHVIRVLGTQEKRGRVRLELFQERP